ncbi:histidine--tRNA ligase [Klenkia taihuensis]|uniref:Histidine--tRNA ligase n=1 Tax=Klenkia taihuensis TaxID=1225127 RepID=A0A1I1T9A0_9ACTN|nr:histidine--tRNA ligase [Klenkia taihuensis]GHE12919.1 histidine--tRNA ligase [Klenkia taihuensis]SFD55204.1 histidyl-tRNA synthetase [Klenkia taihuensis]
MSDIQRAPKGTFDRLPPDSAAYLAARDALVAPLLTAGYGYVETPVFEETAVFSRGVGESTDVVSKEMYTFADRGGRSLTLRPEFTAGVMRAFIEHRLYAGALPAKLWTVGSAFRYERPQAGRYRHFTQVSVEALGVDDPALDAELVALADAGFRGLGLTDYDLQLTSLGDATCRPQYRDLLVAFLAGLDLDEDTRQRAAINPLRVLDDKRPEVQAQLADAPLMVDHLSDTTKAHYDAVRQHLSDLGVTWVEAPRLVRGLDYYTKTTFEFVHRGLGAQASIGGGGRYDGLSAALGGPDLSGIGYAVGVDRTILAAQAEGLDIPVTGGTEVFVVHLGEEAKRFAVRLVGQLRAAGVAADTVYGGRGLKGAMKAADRSGAARVVVVGDRDLAEGVAQVKTMATGEQVAVPLGELAESLRASV